MTAIDWIVLAGYGGVVLVLGLISSRNAKDETDYFLAGRKEGWMPVAASTWATKLSALTFIGVPGAAISGNFAYLQLWFGSFLAAYLVAFFFIPEFYRLRVSTIYEYLGRRIGPETRLGGTMVFIVSRCLASAVRLAGCAIAVSVFFDLSLNAAIALIAGLAVAYVLSGGLRAVIWTDCLQLALFLGGAIATIVFIGLKLPDGFAQIISTGAANDKFRIFDFSLSFGDATTFWMGNLFAVVLGVATGGADQDIAQRALACPTARKAKIALLTAGVGDLISTFLFLSAGIAIFSYYQAFPHDTVTALIAQNRHDYLFPHFISHDLPEGLRGALIAALFAAAMSSLDSALSGLASSAYFDLGFMHRSGKKTDLAGPRLLVIVFAIILALIASSFGAQPSILWFGLKIMGYTYGGLLGLFLLALFFEKTADDRSCLIAVLSSTPVVVIATNGWLAVPAVAWPWAVIIGVTWTCVSAILLSLARRRTELNAP
ncbi:MAG: sodium:solute symporter family transporter [Hyphomicrobiaceae bacterium]